MKVLKDNYNSESYVYEFNAEPYPRKVVCEECMNITYRISVPIGYRCYPVNQSVVSFRNLGHIVEDRYECPLLCIKHLERSRHIHIISLRNQVNLFSKAMVLALMTNTS